jgi:hypothetical protein
VQLTQNKKHKHAAQQEYTQPKYHPLSGIALFTAGYYPCAGGKKKYKTYSQQLY